MRKLVSVIALGVVAIAAYQRSHRTVSAPAQLAEPPGDLQVERETPSVAASTRSRYHCDGRTYCSEMTSCEEATWFLQNCPGVKMDGEGDGVPCERQWCGSH